MICTRTPTEGNSLIWWKENQDKYPLLSKLARSYLAIQGISVPSELVFSTLRDIVSAQQAALSPECGHVDFLKNEFETLNEAKHNWDKTLKNKGDSF